MGNIAKFQRFTPKIVIYFKLRYTLMGVVPLSNCCVILSISSNTASSVECSFLKPYLMQKYKSLT